MDDFMWFVGLFEGEGTILLTRRPLASGEYSQHMRLIIRMVDEDIIRRAHALVGGHVRGPIPGRADNHTAQWEWGVTKSAEAAELLQEMMPYLSERRRKRGNEVLNGWMTQTALSTAADES